MKASLLASALPAAAVGLSVVDGAAAAPDPGVPVGGVVPGRTGAAAADQHTARGIFFNGNASGWAPDIDRGTVS
jgi:hypothetical protein